MTLSDIASARMRKRKVVVLSMSDDTILNPYVNRPADDYSFELVYRLVVRDGHTLYRFHWFGFDEKCAEYGTAAQLDTILLPHRSVSKQASPPVIESPLTQAPFVHLLAWAQSMPEALIVPLGPAPSAFMHWVTTRLNQRGMTEYNKIMRQLSTGVINTPAAVHMARLLVAESINTITI